MYPLDFAKSPTTIYCKPKARMLHTNHSSAMEPSDEGRSNEKSKMHRHIKVSKTAKCSDVTATKTLFKLKAQGNPNLDLIRLSVGDPTVYGNFSPSSTALEAVLGQLWEGKHAHGKGPPCGERPRPVGRQNMKWHWMHCTVRTSYVSYRYTRPVVCF